MQELRRFSYIPGTIPRHKILKRMGYNRHTTMLTEGIMEEIDARMDIASELIDMKAVCLRSKIEKKSSCEGLTIVKNGVYIDSRKLCGFLAGSDELIVMGITGGDTISAEIRRLQDEGMMTAAVILDAAAGEIVDEGFNWLAGLYSKELMREGRLLTNRRFSAGYGDFDIVFQKDIYRLLNLESIGVEITESCMLLPEKTVTAVYGILKS
jgi:hypothetical protein